MAGLVQRNAGSPGHVHRRYIQTCLTLRAFFGLPLRQTTGLGASLLELAGLDWAVPNFNTLSRHPSVLNVAIPYRPSTGSYA